MASLSINLLLLVILLSIPNTLAQSNGNVAPRSTLTATETSNPWVSASGDFAFGFQQHQDNRNFVLGIWYAKIPGRTFVWWARTDDMIPRGSTAELNAQTGIVVRDPRGTELWNTEGISRPIGYGFMNDTGNFVLVGRDNTLLWETFKNPTDTLLPTQTIEIGGIMLVSRQTETSFSPGRFFLRLLQNGNLALTTRSVSSNSEDDDEYYNSSTYDSTNETNSGYLVVFDETATLRVLRRNNQTQDLTSRSRPLASENYYRITLDFDGILTQYYHPKSFTGQTNWTSIWSQPDNICINIDGDKGSGACGYNSYCTLDANRRPICQCPDGYILIDPNNTYGSCKPSFVQSCDDIELSLNEDMYEFKVLTNIDWPKSDYQKIAPSDEQECQSACLQDCLCVVAIYRNNSCWKKKLPLSNGRVDTGLNSKAFLKHKKGNDSIRGNPGGSPGVPNLQQRKDRGTLIVVGSALLGTSILINTLFFLSACLGFYLIRHRKNKFIPATTEEALEMNLRCFTYKDLVKATNGFKEEIGRGASGIVYKGMMPSFKNIVAVKKLDGVAQNSDKDFRSEVNAIGQTHQKNLVRLLGYCDEGQNRLLVYEYLSNGTLSSFLFGDQRPSWNQRKKIALGIARGLSYLHEECNTQVIHCDIKPQNILLDDYYNARISDFGLAKLIMINQSRTQTNIRGTKGYVAPEWFRNTPITAKVDVYSFGVLLLEIISCRKSLEDPEKYGGEQAILTDWVWDCFSDQRLDALAENDEEALNDLKHLEKFAKVGIWCIQENPSLRPTMREVSQMLEGVAEVPAPPMPPPFSMTTTTAS